jgi:hypothetical protein
MSIPHLSFISRIASTRNKIVAVSAAFNYFQSLILHRRQRFSAPSVKDLPLFFFLSFPKGICSASPHQVWASFSLPIQPAAITKGSFSPKVSFHLPRTLVDDYDVHPDYAAKIA